MSLRKVSHPVVQGKWQARWALVRQSPRVIVLALLILALFVTFGKRLWYLQFAQGEYYRSLADRQRLKTVDIPTARGIIYDRNGTPLVRNIPSFKVTIIPANLPDYDVVITPSSSPGEKDAVEVTFSLEAENVLIRLAVLLDMPYTSAGVHGGGTSPEPGLREMVTQAIADGAYYSPLVVRQGVERDTALLIAQERIGLPGVSVEVDARREYPYGALVSQLVGYLLPIPQENEEAYTVLGYDPATDRIGMAGVEYTCEDVLRGQKGKRLIEEDVLGRFIRVIEEQATAVPGGNVYLTLDLDLQQAVEEALRRGMAAVNSPRGVAIVMNPQTGEILAMVSLPTYDNNWFAQGISTANWQQLTEDPHRPLLNHAIADHLQPGSTFKVVVATAALQEGVLTSRTRLNCPGTIVIPNKYYPNDPGQATPFHCWHRAGHGWLDVVGAIANSCNIFFYKTGGGYEPDHFEGLGPTRIAQYARLFGFNQPTGVELTGESAGHVPDPTWKRLTYGESWSTGDTYNFSIGEGYLEVTPLQLLNAVNVIANGGTLYRPRIVHHVTDAQGNIIRPFTPEVSATLPISPENWLLVQQGMEGAVAYGTAARARIEGIRIAGKTGTAQYCDDIARATGICRVGYAQPTHAWFVAYAPVEKPAVSVVVFLYNGGEGSIYAAPVAREILEYYFGRSQPAMP